MADPYLKEWKVPDGTVLAMRPIHERDGLSIANALEGLSPETRRLRFLVEVKKIPDAFVPGLTEPDPALQYVVIVVRRDIGGETPIAGGRIVAGHEPGTWEFALLVGDAWQGQGVGKQLLTALIEEAERRNVRRLIGNISVDNRPMLRLARKKGFSIARDTGDTSTCIAILDINSRPKHSKAWIVRWLTHCMSSRRMQKLLGHPFIARIANTIKGKSILHRAALAKYPAAVHLPRGPGYFVDVAAITDSFEG